MFTHSKALLAALDNHLNRCKKKTVGAVAGMIEYILIAGVNDTPTCAELLGRLLSDRNVMLNLIPYNDTTERCALFFLAKKKERGGFFFCSQLGSSFEAHSWCR